MNYVCLMGRITKDLEPRVTPSGKRVVSFTLAVDRQTKEQQTDFINCVAWEKTADMLCKWFGKGRLVLIEGNIQVRTWNAQDGSKRYATDVIVNRVHFTGEKKQDDGFSQGPIEGMSAGFEDYTEEMPDEDDLPF